MKNKLLKKIVVWGMVLSIGFEATPVWALSKEETIYAKLNSDGTTNSVTISEHLNDNGSDTISDKSHLSNINNVNGDETYTESNGKLVWEANGSDIYYQGTTSEKLPIEMDVKYYLDGKEMSVNDMLGKKGTVKIVLNFKNNEVNYVTVNGKQETLYTPFVVATTSLLSNTSNKNIKVTNGRVIDNGVTSVVVAISSPGLYDSLGVDELKSLDTVEISYDTTDFELSSIYSVATSKILEDDDLDIFNNVKDLYSSISALQDNMDKLVSASSSIKDGSSKLASGTKTLNEKISALSSKYFSLRNIDKDTLKKELSSFINQNISALVPTLKQAMIDETTKVVNNHKDEIEKELVNYGIKNTKEVINGEIDKIVSNIDVSKIVTDIIGSDLKVAIMSDESIQELSNVFRDELISELQSEISDVTKSTIDDMADSIGSSMTDEQKKAYIQSIADTYGVTFEQAAGIVSKVQGDTVSTIKNSSDAISNKVSSEIIGNLSNKDYVNKLVSNYTTNVNKRIMEIVQNDENLDTYKKELIKNISTTIKTELSKDEVIKKYSEASSYVDGIVDTIVEKTATDLADEFTEDLAKEVVNNMINEQFSDAALDSELNKILSTYEDDINAKLNIVDENVSKLRDSVSLLNDGATELSDGLKSFDEGLNKYNDEGISKLSGFINGDIKDLTSKIEALANLSNNYETMDDIDSNADGSSKIIFMIDAVKKEKEKQVNTEQIVEKKTFWQKIKGLFK